MAQQFHMEGKHMSTQNLNMSVHRSITHNSQKVETTHMSINC